MDADRLEPGGTAVVGAGGLTVNGALAGPTATFSAPQSLAFTATFSNDPFQHVGFGVDFNDSANWAMFSTGGGAASHWALGAYHVGGVVINERINTRSLAIDPLVPHDYEIRWTADQVRLRC